MAVSGQFPVDMPMPLSVDKTAELRHTPVPTAAPSTLLMPSTEIGIAQPASSPNRAPLMAGIGVIAVLLIVIIIGVVLASHNNTTPVAVALAPSATLTPVPPTMIPTTVIPASATAIPPSVTVPTTAVPTTQIPITPTLDPRDTLIAQQQAALLSINTLQAAFTATAQQGAVQTTIQAATANAQLTVAALTQQAPTLTPTLTLTATGTAAAGSMANMNMSIPTLAPSATGTITAAPTASPSVGMVTFSDKAKAAHADSLHLAINGVPLPAEGQVYEAWLLDSVHPSLLLGKISIRADGSGTLDYTDPKNANLLISYSAVMITAQDSGNLQGRGTVMFSGDILPSAAIHIQHIIATFPNSPGNIGLVIGALQQESILTDHVALLSESIKQGNVALAKLHLEHVYNIITGTDGAKDINGDGKLTISPPGDGFGIFAYLTNGVEHAVLSANQPDASDAIKTHAANIQIEAANVTTTYTQMQALILQAADMKTIADMKPLIAQIASLNDTVLKGVPDASGKVTPTKGSGALDALYADALAMADMPIFPGDTAVKEVVPSALTSASSPIPTVPPTLPPTINVPDATIITIQETQFMTPNVTIKAGTSIVFQNQSNENHTATADDNSFDTGIIPAGANSKPIQFKTAGTYPYYCQFHGGPGGVRMAGVITVQ